MSLVVNNNLMAANTARNLNAHYGRLATSTQRLSSGLRINSAADDAAGLAIRELQRADIAALQQGARNANDAISMIQVADGSLGIIDEKLIRMKELAEQAATGTYDSTQRLMIESEYQAMASEITRIANSTDFNGMKLLDGTLAGEHDGSGLVSEGKMKIHFGTGNDSAEDYYYVEIGECTAQAFGLGNASTWEDVQRRGLDAFADSMKQQIKNDTTLTAGEKGDLLASLEKDENGEYKAGSVMKELESFLNEATSYETAYKYWNTADEKFWVGNSDLMDRYMAAAATPGTASDDEILTEYKANHLNGLTADMAKADTDGWDAAKTAADAAAAATGGTATDDDILAEYKANHLDGLTADMAQADATGWAAAKDTADAAAAQAMPAGDPDALKNFWDGLRTTEQQKLQYAWGQAAIAELSKGLTTAGTTNDIPDTTALSGLTTTDGNPISGLIDNALAYMEKQVGHMDFAGHTIETQEDAQHALDAINQAIVSKDKIRAHLGATQNRLENTVSNLNIQAENLQAAESRISDVDVATEMTQFVRNQILTQSAVAMLSQANSLPQMAMQLIGG